MANPAFLATEKLKQAVSANEPLTFRQPPHNLEAEQALLGAILVNNEALDRVSGFLSPDHFFDPLHGRIFETLATLIHAGKTATPITVKTFFENVEPIDANMTVPQYLGRLAANATTIINAAEYGRTVYDLSTRRSLIIIGEDLVNTAYDSAVDHPPRAQIEEAEGRLYSLAEQNKYGKGFETFKSALTTAIEMANSAFQRSGHLSGASTGLADLDNKLGGLQRSDLVILAGRPSMGKTALVTNIAYNVAKAYRGERQPDGSTQTTDGGIVGFFSLEMSSEQLATRILSEQAEISSEKIRRGMIDENEFRKLSEVASEMSRIPLFIDQTGGITIAQLSARARKLKRQHGLDLLVVDYLQLLAGSKAAQRQPRAGNHRDHDGPQGARERAGRADHRAVAAFTSGRKPRRQAPAALRPSRIGLDRAGRRRRHVRLPRGILRRAHEARRRNARICRLDDQDEPGLRQGRSHHRQAASRSGRHGRTVVRRAIHALWQSGPRLYAARTLTGER